MVKGGKKTNIGYVYGVMEELQQLRDSVAALTEKNRDLAKQLNVTKMELANERKQMQAVLVDHVRTWTKMSKRAASSSCHATVQCDLSQGENSNVIATDTSGSGQETPPPRVVRSPHDSRRSLSPTIKFVRRELLLVETRRRETSSYVQDDDDVHMQTPSPPKRTESTASPDLTLEAEDTVARSLAPQYEEHRRLRHRTHQISYIEPPLNRKIRRGDFYGFIKRPRNMSPRPHTMQKRRQSSNHTTAIISLMKPAPRTSTSPARRATRPRPPVSYVLPKLNTKLRQGDQFTFTT